MMLWSASCWALLIIVTAISPTGTLASTLTKSEIIRQSRPSKPIAFPKEESLQHIDRTAVSVPSSDATVKRFEKRPSVDSGLRYSSNDWLVNFLATPGSFILKRIRYQLLSNAALCLVVLFFYPKYPGLAMPLTGHSLLSSSLGLLLSYRTNSAYARFWEARGHWTQTKSTCRNLAISIRAHIEPHSPKSAAIFLNLLAAFPAALMHLCLGGTARLPDHVTRLLPPQHPDESPALPAIHLCMRLHQTIHEAVLESPSADVALVEAAHMTAVTHLIDTLMDNMSACEKILRTPVPWTYSRHTSRFLTLWMGTLPFALVGTLNRGLTLCVVVAASYCMLGIEEIGHLIEQPFLGDALDGDDQVWSVLDADGEAAPLLKRGRTTQPYDIGIPVCTLAAQIRTEILMIAGQEMPHVMHGY